MSTHEAQWWRNQSRWWLWLIAALFAVVAATLSKVADEPYWAAALAAAVAFVGTDVVRELNRRLDVAEARNRIWRETAVHWVDSGRRLPRVSALTPQLLGARTPLVQIEYQNRDVEEKIRTALKAGEPVLVVGPSMVGKSRVAAEVIRNEYPDLELWQPLPPDGLANRLREGIPSGVVVWLDDLDHHLGSSHLRIDWLRQLAHPTQNNVVIATMRAKKREAIAATDDELDPQARVVQEQFTDIDFYDDSSEKKRLAAAINDANISNGIDKYGLGTYLGGGHRAVGRYNDGRSTHRLGVAMVQAAADWRRIGLDAIPKQVLETLSSCYIDDEWHRHPEEAPSEALIWASAREDDVVQLLERVGDDSYRVTDYLLDHLTPERAQGLPSIPDATWQSAGRYAVNPRDANLVARTALHSRQEALSRMLFDRVIESEHQEETPQAALGLGVISHNAGNLDQARTWYRKAIDTDHTDAAPTAMLNLGILEKRAGNTEQR